MISVSIIVSNYLGSGTEFRPALPENGGKNMIRLIVTDLDGTLLDEDRTISDEAVEIIRAVSRRGVDFTFITGRPWHGARRFARRAGIQLPTITCNGAVINQGEQILWSAPMLLAPLRELMERAAALGLTVLYSKDGGESALSATEWTQARDYPIAIPDWTNQRADKVNLISGDRRAEFRGLMPLMDTLRGQYEIVRYEDAGCEIAGKGVNKAEALKRYAALRDVSLEEVLAIGDNENDLEMLRLAGVGAAVANATAAAKEAADYVCRKERTEGVVEAVREFCLEGAEL